MLVMMEQCIIILNQYYQFNGNKKKHFIFKCNILYRTNQHSCNDVNSDCALLLQYTCNDTLRDGTTTTYEYHMNSSVVLFI